MTSQSGLVQECSFDSSFIPKMTSGMIISELTA